MEPKSPFCHKLELKLKLARTLLDYLLSKIGCTSKTSKAKTHA
jgi:hypothetical protein